MTQRGLEVAPASRQDIISALLDGYGNSFGRGDESPYNYSPVPALKELPPPPPAERERSNSNDKPLPSAGYMSMRFQLRDEPYTPASPEGSKSPLDNQPTEIVSRSLSRSSKPASLKLLASNGATAIKPSTPAASSHASTPLSSRPKEEEKSLPPPPPEKSERRQVQSNQEVQRPPRKDSLQSQDGKKVEAEIAGPVKRKPVPQFTSLAALGNGPRGGKGGPMPPPRPRKQTLEQVNEKKGDDADGPVLQVNIVDIEKRGRSSSKSSVKSQGRPDIVPQNPLPVVNQEPPTPQEETRPAPPPPRKAFVPMGLPSNPRSKSQEAPKHLRGKSSTGFDMMKSSMIAAPPQPAPKTLTPDPTPSPQKTERAQQAEEPTPASPVDDSKQPRPFSFEGPPAPVPPRKQQPAPAPARSASPVSPVNPPANSTAFPPRSASRAPAAFAGLPSQQRCATPEEPTPEESAPPTPRTPEPFQPLTVKPEPTLGPSVTRKHYNCYSNHSTYVWSRNDFQPMACMVCQSNEKERKWACVWCYLRICVGCSTELMKTPGRDLSVVMEKRGVQKKQDSRHDSGTGGNPHVVVWDADAENDFS